MNGYINIVRILMVFLLLGFVVPVAGYAQEGYMPVTGTFSFEGKTSDESGGTNADKLQKNQQTGEEDVAGNDLSGAPESFTTIDISTKAYMSKMREQYALQEHENSVRLDMKGNINAVEATQREGEGNIMDLGINGNNNVANYLQQGSENYIYDRIEGNGIYREIEQYGNDHGIYNEGMQTVPMIIEQRGAGMKIKIH